MKKVKVCPKCGSTKIKLPPAGMDFTISVRDYCEDCGERGNFPTLDEDAIDEFLDDLSKKE